MNPNSGTDQSAIAAAEPGALQAAETSSCGAAGSAAGNPELELNYPDPS